MSRKFDIFLKIATATAVAIVVYSCKGKLDEKDLDMSNLPIQTVENAFYVQTENGIVKMRMEADLMERFDEDTLQFELFPMGFAVYAYTENGQVETEITSDNARHRKFKDGRETWEAFGNVVVKNIIKKEVMETDTLFWDRQTEKIYTDCYVKMYSPDGFMQGYGMESDQRARNSEIFNPFQSYGILSQDSLAVKIDSINFIGPFLKK